MSFWQRLWCTHCWTEGLPVDVLYGVGYITEYTCHKCGKRKNFSRMPISYVSDHQHQN